MKLGGTLTSSALIYTFANALNAAIPFFLLPVLTRALTPAEYGTIAMFGVVVSLLAAFTGLSVHGAVGIRYFEQDKFDLPTYVATCLMILGISTTAVLAAVSLTSAWLEEFTKLPGIWLLIAVLVSGAQFVIQIRLTLWQSAGQPWKYGTLQIAQSALNAGLSLWLVLGLKLSWEGRLSGQVLATFVFLLIAIWSLRIAKLVKFPASREYTRNALQFGLPLIPHTLGGVMIAMVDRFMISNMLDVSKTGIYTVALQFGMILGLLTDSFNRAFAPWLFERLKRKNSQLERGIVRYTYLHFVVVFSLAILMGVFAPQALAFLAGEKFHQASDAVIYIALGFAFGGMYYMVTNYVFFVGRTGSLAVITFLSGILNVVTTYVLIKVNGVVGAAQGFMISQAALFLGTWWLSHNVHPMPWRKAMINMDNPKFFS